jgi:type IV secretory pathway VirB2 component (pilin)
MPQTSHTTRPFLAAIGIAAATLFTPSHSWAAGEAVLPWGYTLDVIQNFVAGPLAHFVIVTSSIVALLAFGLAGDTELARRFAKTVVGTGLALLAVQLLNYLAL